MVLLLMVMAMSANAQDERVIYAPDVVGVDRLFMVVLRAPVEATEIAVSVPDSVVLLDKTRMPARSEERRYYFRAVKATEKAEIRFAHPDGEVVVPVAIWTFSDLCAFRELKGTQLPRRWPLGERLPELKQRQTVTKQADIDAAKAGGPGRGEQWAGMSDDDIWGLQPDMTIPRWHWVNVSHGCPVHGTEIYKTRAYYPWIKDASFPYKWKIECPVGHEVYPSNDFGKGDFTSGDFPDDGIGGGYVHGDQHYGFIAELCQLYCHQMLKVAPDSAQAYLATGDVKYLHKALVAFCRLGVEYAYLATMTQHRHRNSQSQVNRLGQGRFDEGPILANSAFTVYTVDNPGYQWVHAEAYDKIWPDIEKDAEIIPFLQGKGFDVKTHEDVRRFIEENLFAVWVQGSMDGAINSNEPFTQRGLSRTAEVLDYARSGDFLDWLYDGAGKMRVFVPNTFFRDGAPYESTGGYNSMHVTALGPIIESVEHLRKMRPEVVTEAKYPALSKSRRYRNVFDFCMDTVTIDRTYPQIGDGGGHPSYAKLPTVAFHDASTEAFEHAYELFREPKFAWALAHTKGWQPSREFAFTREEIEAEAAKWPDDWNDASALHDGYGIAILRSGEGEQKRALWMHYGHARGHVQDDLMDIGLDAYQGKILNHMGYPRNWGYWEYAWSSHHLARQLPEQSMVARAELMADAGPAHVTEARAQAHPEFADDGSRATPDPDYWQRRMLAIVDVAPDRFYCVDFYRISGGENHWWAFHGQEGEFATEGIALTKQETGTLAGAEVPYADAKWMEANGCSLNASYGWRGFNFVFAHLYNVEKGFAEQPWSASWKLKTGEGLGLRLNVLQAAGADGSPVEVNITDGKAASGGSPYEMKWIMVHNAGQAPAKTQVLSLIEPYMNDPIIRQATPVALSGADEAGFAAGACRVETEGRTDTLFCASDGSVERTTEDGFRFAGRFGLWAEEDGQPVAISLVGGTVLQKGDLGIKLESAEYRGKITKVDRATETITVEPAPAAAEALVGQCIFIVNGARRVACKVVAAEKVGTGVELLLYMDSCIGTGKVTGTQDHRVLTDTPFALQRFGYYEGARVANADGTAEYRLDEVRGGSAAMIDAEAAPEAKAATLAGEFPEGSWFKVYDYGVGDEVVWPYAVSVIKRADNVYEVRAPVPV
ncbi:MAG: hypothetical protein FJX75_12125, partial [Armatimonadetes bacterium]|nr:hypothetical protein [Armatimonadota bacterium]